MPVLGGPTRPRREPNCRPGETREDAPHLVHDWKIVSEDYGTDYYCPRCGLTGSD